MDHDLHTRVGFLIEFGLDFGGDHDAAGQKAVVFPGLLIGVECGSASGHAFHFSLSAGAGLSESFFHGSKFLRGPEEDFGFRFLTVTLGLVLEVECAIKVFFILIGVLALGAGAFFIKGAAGKRAEDGGLGDGALGRRSTDLRRGFVPFTDGRSE